MGFQFPRWGEGGVRGRWLSLTKVTARQVCHAREDSDGGTEGPSQEWPRAAHRADRATESPLRTRGSRPSAEATSQGHRAERQRSHQGDNRRRPDTRKSTRLGPRRRKVAVPGASTYPRTERDLYVTVSTRRASSGPWLRQRVPGTMSPPCWADFPSSRAQLRRPQPPRLG